MKDEEMAKEYRKALKQRLIDEDDFERLEKFDENVEEAFLAGLKAGSPQWHDLRENPNDLPEKYSISYPLSRTVVNQIGTPCHYNYASECWQNWSYIEIETPIAWCKIPTFDKE